MQIEALLDKYSEIFDNRLHQYIDYKLKEDGYDEFYDAMGHIPLTTGKRIRPILAVLSCEAVGGRSDDAMELALAVELLHNASLIHDDIIDGDKKRRNVPTVHEKYGVPIAINVGDALVGEAFYMIAMLPKVRMQKYGLAVVKELFVSFTLATKGLYSGEAQDIEFMDRLDITEEEYMKMVMKKTSSLYMLSTRGGAILGGGNTKEIEELSKFGRDFGIMFQIKDDLLGIVGKEELLGKTVGIDIKGRKRTLYMVHALHNASEKDKSELNKILKRKYMPGDIDLEMEIFERTGSIDYCEKKLQEIKDSALSHLEILPSSEAKQALSDLVDWSIEREI
ncbi:MAG: polyprenyl synthetase family protein [Candidatus Methanoliparum thermophilum]|uniref:Polyprenyl synthetase family protein n=1 Tax=Methanoliparum thermophilum TaxID=2491083 RepID=A0A520KRX9_METT2|nr:MAG: polyprenyl synthetase family protein [Candidatus Methanoliparum thermophilum]